MALNLRETPRCLQSDPVGEVWPGDPAVDLAASDLVAWCAEGGQAGLVLRTDETPTVIRWTPLTPQAYSAVKLVAGRDPAGYVVEAAARGVLPSPADGLVRESGIPRLTEGSLARLGERVIDLPIHAAYDALAVAEGRAPGDPSLREEMVEASLAELLGLHILAATFRIRRSAR